MKIAIDCRMSGKSGIGLYLDELLPFFLKNFDCVLLGLDTALMTSSEPLVASEAWQDRRNVQTANNATFVIPCDIPPFSLKEMFAFPKKIADEINKCDAYFSPYCNIPSGIKIPIFSTIHDIVFLDIKGLSSKLGTFARKICYKRAIKKSKAIFTVSEFSKSRIQKKLHCKKPIVVTYSAEPSYIRDATGGADRAGEKIEKQNNILFVGNIKKHKGLAVLLDAFEKIVSTTELSALRLVIVGENENFRSRDDAIFNRIKSLPKDSVVFTGKISDDELKSYYKTAKLLVQPSFYEGFGVPPLEALLSGTNVVLSDIEVFKEIYGDFPITFFKTGDAFDLAEKIKRTLEKPSPKNIPEKYSFEKTFEIIKEQICCMQH